MTEHDKRCPIEFLALTTHEGVLYGVSRAGTLVPLYVYGPLAAAYAAPTPYKVDFAPDWPQYARSFVMQYLPFPELTAEQLPDDLEPKITLQERIGDHRRPWKQTLYNGWPLYFARGGPHAGLGGSHPMMFVPATVDMPTPQVMKVQFSSEDAGEVEHQEKRETTSGVFLPGPYIGP